MSDNEQSDCEIGERKRKPLRSVVWETFSVLDRQNYVAMCNICHAKLSFKTTVTNLKKHVVRKHPHIKIGLSQEENFHVEGAHEDSPKIKRYRPSEAKPCFRERPFYQREEQNRPKSSFDIQKAKLSDIGGLEGLIINVIGEDGEAIVTEANEGHEGDQVEAYEEEAHDHRGNKKQKEANFDPAEKKRRSRIMELQLECLEIKKYNMQLEALLLEQQLSVRRSVFTEPLKYSDSFSRGTQTDVGGEKTRVFYLADGKGGTPRRHLFAMQEEEED